MDKQKIKYITSAKAIWPNIDKVISMCALEFFKDWKIWVDCEGNFLSYENDKFVMHKRINQICMTTADIYRKSPPENFISKSYWGLNVENKVLALLGKDGLLRYSLFSYDEKWVENRMPLWLGYDVLNVICNEYLNEEYKETRIQTTIPQTKLSGWLTIKTQSLEKENKIWLEKRYKQQD